MTGNRTSPFVNRREMLTALAGSAAGALAQAQERRPRIACCVTFWGGPGSHADWILCKLMDG
jgi:hypothetical protein